MSSDMLSFTPGAGIWASFRVLSNIVYLISYVLALPVQLFLHRRIGERYLNPVIFLLSLIVAASLLVLGDYLNRFDLPRRFAMPNLGDRLPITTLYVAVPVGMVVAYALHRFGIWWRERQGLVIHSRSWGVPHLWSDTSKEKDVPPAFRPAAPASNLLQELWYDFRAACRQITIDQAQGRVPQGRLPWLFVTVAQPVFIFGFGLALQTASVALGMVLVGAGIGMFLQGRIAAAFLYNHLLDHRDSRIEQDAWLAIVQSKPHSGEQQGYALPIPARLVTKPVRESIAARLVRAEPAYEKILQPAFEIEAKMRARTDGLYVDPSSSRAAQ